MNLSRKFYNSNILNTSPTAKLMFRCTGLPPENSVKTISISQSQNFFQIKKIIKEAFGINPLMVIQLLHNGKFIPDNIMVYESSIFSLKDEIIVMAVMNGA